MSARSALVKQLPCLACLKWRLPQPLKTEEHHLLVGGRAGQRRRGDSYSASLCGWHHRGEIADAWPTKLQMTAVFGPSLATESRRFKAEFYNDDQLLELTNSKLEAIA